MQSDVAKVSVVWTALVSMAREMGLILKQTAYSAAVREGSDFSTGLFDAQGNLLAQGDYSPGHLGSMAFVVQKVLEYYPAERLEPGDEILVNDPGIGSGHLPDMFLVTPVFLDQTRIGYTASIAHHADVGGMSGGSQAIQGITENFQEGIRFLPVRCWHRGRPVEEVFRIIEANVRVPDVVRGDILAQKAANAAGAVRLQSLARRYGVEGLFSATAGIMDRSERAMRNAIAAMPLGRYCFEDRLDDTGPGTDPVIAKVAVTIAHNHIHADWNGSSQQRAVGINSYWPYTFAYTMAAIKSVTLPNAPQNAGAIRTVRMDAPEGSFFNPRHPAPCGGRAVLAHRIFEVVMGALAQAVPDKALAASSNFFNPIFSGSADPTSCKPFIYYEIIAGGMGARADKDGVEGLMSPMNASNIPIEIVEQKAPVIIERLELIRDSGGAGRFRGACGLRKDIRLLADNVRLDNCGDRVKTAPFGLNGGHAGRPARTILDPATDKERTLESKGTYKLRAGALLRIETAGGGGQGDPRARDPIAVERDVRDGFVSVDAARDVYGLEIPAQRSNHGDSVKRHP